LLHFSMKKSNNKTHRDGRRKGQRIAASMKAACSITGLAKDVVQTAKKAGCEAFLANGSVRCDDLIEWIAERPEILEAANDSPNFELERALKTRAERRLKEHELDLRHGSVIPVDEVRRAVTQMVFSAKRKLLAIPKRMSQRLAAETDAIEIEERLNDELYDALESLSKGEWIEESKKDES
jgi:hypothetical protein